MAQDVIDVQQDSRMSHCRANLNGRNYHYLHGVPKAGFHDTVFLIHGWPDLSAGWRYQVPMFLNIGLRVVCLDLMGFGGTDAPDELSEYSCKRAARDINELAQQLGITQIIIGGHDWGGAVVYRVALWYPSLVSLLFSVCTPFGPPRIQHVPLEKQVKTALPNFRYQLQFIGGDVEERISSKSQLRQMLNAMYGGRGPNGEVGFTVKEGLVFENLPMIRPTPLLSETEMDYYVDQYCKNGIGPTLNWYRTREVNYEEELQLQKLTIDIPVLFLSATRDEALPPVMSRNMDNVLPKLTRREVNTGHWALWEAPEEVNNTIHEWLRENGVKPMKSAL